jgi:hypothetical protein
MLRRSQHIRTALMRCTNAMHAKGSNRFWKLHISLDLVVLVPCVCNVCKRTRDEPVLVHGRRCLACMTVVGFGGQHNWLFSRSCNAGSTKRSGSWSEKKQNRHIALPRHTMPADGMAFNEGGHISRSGMLSVRVSAAFQCYGLASWSIQ